MAHEGIREHLKAYLDGELDRRTKRMVASHLEGCGECRAELEALQAIGVRLKDLPEAKSPLLLREQIMERAQRERRLDQAARRPASGPRTGFHWSELIAALGVVIIMAYVAFPVLSRWRQPAPVAPIDNTAALEDLRGRTGSEDPEFGLPRRNEPGFEGQVKPPVVTVPAPAPRSVVPPTREPALVIPPTQSARAEAAPTVAAAPQAKPSPAPKATGSPEQAKERGAEGVARRDPAAETANAPTVMSAPAPIADSADAGFGGPGAATLMAEPPVPDEIVVVVVKDVEAALSKLRRLGAEEGRKVQGFELRQDENSAHAEISIRMPAKDREKTIQTASALGELEPLAIGNSQVVQNQQTGPTEGFGSSASSPTHLRGRGTRPPGPVAAPSGGNVTVRFILRPRK